MPALRRPRKRANGRVSGATLQRGAQPVHGLLERRAVVRRAERHGVRDALRPLAAARAGAARDEPAHRMPDERDPLDLDRPFAHQPRQQVVQRSAVRRRSGGRCCSGRPPASSRAAVRVAVTAPRVLGLAQPVHEHGDVRHARLPDPPRFHRNRQRAALGLQLVAEEPVERGERHHAARRLGQQLVQRPRRRPPSSRPTTRRAPLRTCRARSVVDHAHRHGRRAERAGTRARRSRRARRRSRVGPRTARRPRVG